MAELDPTTCDARRPDRSDTPRASALDRRTMLKGLAVAGASVPLLAACGSDNDSSGTDPTKSPSGGGDTTPTSPGSDPTTTGSSGGGEVLTKASAVPVGSGVILAKAGYVVTQPTKGTFEGFSNICTHQGCPVTSISGDTINCPCHGSMYSIEDGSVTGGPAPAPLKSQPVKVDGDNIVPA